MPEPGQERLHGLRHTQHAQRDGGGDTERALRADEDAEEIGPFVLAQVDELAVREHDLEREHVVDREPVLEAVRAARVLGHVAADRAHLLARRIRCVEEALGRDRARDVEVGHARLDDDALRAQVDVEHPVHARERDHDAVRDRRGAAREAGAGAARTTA